MSIQETYGAAARRAVPRVTVLAAGSLAAVLGHGLVQIVGGLLFIAAVVPGWRGWYRYVIKGDKDLPGAPAAEFRTPGTAQVVLVSVGARRIEVIKALREATHHGFGESKRLVDSVPSIVASGLSDESAQLVSTHLQRSGACTTIEEVH